jgi:hypothetical protein
MNAETFKILSSLGVGGMLAAAMFFVYRHDALASQKRIAELAGQTTTLAHKLIDAVAELRATCARLDAALGYGPRYPPTGAQGWTGPPSSPPPVGTAGDYPPGGGSGGVP